MSKKHRTEEGFYKRLRQLSNISKPNVNETKHVLGTLIDFKRGVDKVAYGIVKENHHYYLKKSNSQDTPTIADFAYIGGLGNITEYQYKSLAEADKQRNMVLITINEALGGKPVIAEEKTKVKQMLNESEDEKEEKGKKPTFKKGEKPDFGKKEDKKKDKEEDKDEKKSKKPTFKKGEKPDFGKKEDEEEDKEKVDEGVEEDLEKSADAAAGLDVAVEKEREVSAPAPVADVEVDAEIPVPDAGGEEMPPAPEGGEEMPDAGGDIDIDSVIGGTAPEGGEEMPPAPEGGEEGLEGGEEGLEGGEEGDPDENNREIEKTIGKLTNRIRKTEMTPAQTQSYLNSLLTSFEDKLPELEVEERKEMANKLLKIVPDEEIADIDIEGDDEMAEAKSCEECGFAKYVSERGHNAESMGSCGDDEMANLMSGYMMGSDEELGDEDYEDMAVFSNDEIQKSLYEEYGHMDVGDKMKPFTDKLNEGDANPEAKTKKIKGMFWWEIDPTKAKKTELVAEEVVDETLNGNDPAAIEVQPNLKEEEEKEEPEVDLDVTVEPEADIDAPEPEIDVFDVSKHETPEMEMTTGFETMGAGIPKPDGAPTVDVSVDAENKTVNVTMNESERKLRKYIRTRLEENAGLRKPNLNENKKSKKIKQLDTMIDEQFNLFENIMKEGGFTDKIATGLEKASQWIEGSFKKQKKINQMLPTLKTGGAVNQLFDEMFGSKISGGMNKYATRTGAEEKLAILKQAAQDPNGLGKIKLDGNQLVYLPVNPQDTKSSSEFAYGHSRLGQ